LEYWSVGVMEKPNDKNPKIPLDIFLHTFFVISIPILHYSITPVLVLFQLPRIFQHPTVLIHNHRSFKGVGKKILATPDIYLYFISG
jgi:hypothetical protein